MKTAYQSQQIMLMPERMRPDTTRVRMEIRAAAADRGIEISANSLRYFSPESLAAILAVIRSGEEPVRLVFATRDRDPDFPCASVTIPGVPDAN